MKNKIHFCAMAVCFAAVALLAGCEKEQQHKILKVSIEGVPSLAKVHLDEQLYPIFVIGDVIKVNGETYASEDAGRVAKFSLKSDNDAESPYYAVYPHTCVASAVTAQPTIILPAEQPYTTHANGEQKLEAPMGGANLTDELHFHNFCSVLEVVVKNPIDATSAEKVYSIEVTSPDLKLSYPSGLQLETAMDPDNPGAVQQLAAQTNSGSTDPDATVTLTGTESAGDIAAGSSKRFLIYLPTYNPGEGNKMTLHVKVNTYNGTKHAFYSFTRSVRLEIMQRSVVNHYSFALSETLRTLEESLFEVSSGTYARIAKHNEGATDQLNLGTYYSNTTDGATNLLSPTEWSTLLGTTGSGLAKVGEHYGWVFLPGGFEYPSSCSSKVPTAGTNDKGVWTVTIRKNNADQTAVREYTSSEWSDMEAAGAVFIPIDVPADPAVKKTTVTKYTMYKTSGYASKSNLYFMCTKISHNDDASQPLKEFTIAVGVNLEIKGGMSLTPFRIRTADKM